MRGPAVLLRPEELYRPSRLCCLLALVVMLPFFWGFAFVFPQGEDFEYMSRAMCFLDLPGGLYEMGRQWLYTGGRYGLHFLQTFLGRAPESLLLNGAICLLSLAVYARKAGEEDKVFSGLARLCEEMPDVIVAKDPMTSETLISGQGELELEIVRQKLLTKFGADAVFKDPKIAYRESIRKTIQVQGRHKKQSGGHGQFGDVWIEFSPADPGVEFEFVDAVVGGAVPRNFIPSVEKGLRENLCKGVLAGFPMMGLRAKLYDGSSHPVDSSEMAFKTAARIAYKQCINASPVLLEPIMHVEISVPDEYMGDIMGDMNKRRGRILGMEQVDGKQLIIAEVPQAEMFKYATDLRSMTQARGSFKMNFERYEEVPAAIAAKIIEAHKGDLVDDEE